MGWSSIKDLQKWVKYQKQFRDRVLTPLEDKLLIEVDDAGKHAIITPLGIAHVQRLLKI